MKKQTRKKSKNSGFFNKIKKSLTSLTMQKAIIAVAIIFTLAFIATAGNVIIKNGQLTAADNVSIGVANPSAKLDVEDTSGAPANSSLLYLYRPNNLVVPDAGNAGLRIKEHSVNNPVYVTNHLNAPLFLIKGNGKIGMGTASPSGQLDIYNGSHHLAMITDDDARGILDLFDQDAAEYLRLYVSYGDAYIRAQGTSPGAIHFLSGNKEVLTVSANGKVGINNSAPSVALDVGGTVRADNFTEYSSVYTGDAIAAIKNIKPEAGAQGSWAAVDHSTLPAGVRMEIKEQVWRNKQTGEILSRASPPEGSESNYELIERTVEGRNLGNSVQLNTRAIQQLIEQNEQLQSRIAALESEVAALKTR